MTTVGRHPVDDVVRRQRAQPGRKENLYLRIQQLLKDLNIQPPQALLDLAAIDAFDLVVTVSFDDLVTRAMDQVRHGSDNLQIEVIRTPGIGNRVRTRLLPGGH